MSEELKPCPLCGSERVVVNEWPAALVAIVWSDIKCMGCSAGLRRATKAEAITAWNRRPVGPSVECDECARVLSDGEAAVCIDCARSVPSCGRCQAKWNRRAEEPTEDGRIRAYVELAMEWAARRWDEWGDRAENVGNILERALHPGTHAGDAQDACDAIDALLSEPPEVSDGRVACRECGGRFRSKKNGLPRGHSGPEGSYCRSPREDVEVNDDEA